MGMDLSNQHGQSFRFTIFSWENMLNLAIAHGWEPEGTQPWEPEDEDDCSWSGGDGSDGSYASNGGQVVTATDSRNLAGALENAQPKKFEEFVHFCRQGEFRIF